MNPIELQAEVFFKYLNLNPDDFPPLEKQAALATFYRLLEMEDIGESPNEIKIDGVKYYAKDNLLDMPLKFLVELANVEDEDDHWRFLHAYPSLIYRKDWSKPYSEKEHIEGQQVFHKSLLIFSLWAFQLFQKLIVTLQENYPVLYSGEKGSDTNGRRMYGLIKMLANNDFTKMEKAENQPIWRAFTWMEQQRIEIINAKNANVN